MALPTDLTLNDNNVTVVAGERVVLNGWDVELWGDGRAAGNAVKTPTTFRRAMVHDFGDQLTLNWGGDYQGGVTVIGDLRIRAAPQKSLLLLNGKLKFNGQPDSVTATETTLLTQLATLAKAIAELEKRVKNLGG